MANAFRCDDCERFVEGSSAGRVIEHAEDYGETESHDLCADCLGAHVEAIQRSADNTTVDDYAGGGGD